MGCSVRGARGRRAGGGRLGRAAGHSGRRDGRLEEEGGAVERVLGRRQGGPRGREARGRRARLGAPAGLPSRHGQRQERPGGAGERRRDRHGAEQGRVRAPRRRLHHGDDLARRLLQVVGVRVRRVQVADVPVEVARLVGLVRAVGARVAPLARVRQQVAPQEEALVGALEHLAAHAAHAAAAALLLQSKAR